MAIGLLDTDGNVNNRAAQKRASLLARRKLIQKFNPLLHTPDTPSNLLQSKRTRWRRQFLAETYRNGTERRQIAGSLTTRCCPTAGPSKRNMPNKRIIVVRFISFSGSAQRVVRR